MCYIENGAQEYIQRLDATVNNNEIKECTTCGRKTEDTVNIGYDENYCLKCCEDGTAKRFITDNEDPDMLDNELYKLKIAHENYLKR